MKTGKLTWNDLYRQHCDKMNAITEQAEEEGKEFRAKAYKPRETNTLTYIALVCAVVNMLFIGLYVLASYMVN